VLEIIEHYSILSRDTRHM